MAAVRRACQEWLLAAESSDYLALVRQLKEMDGVIPECRLRDMSVAATGNPYAEAAIAHFSGLWNLAKNV